MLTLAFGAAVVAGGGVLLLGLPGAVIYELWTKLVEGPGGLRLKPDAAWPVALGVSVLWPWGVVPGSLASRRLLRPEQREARRVLTIAVEVVWTAGVCLLLSYLGR